MPVRLANPQRDLPPTGGFDIFHSMPANNPPRWSWRQPLLWVCSLLLGGLLMGCVTERYRTTIILEPGVQEPLSGAPRASITLGRFKDSRLNAPWYLLLSKPNSPNPLKPTEWAYVTNRSVATILRDGVADALGQNGFKTFGHPSDTFHNNLTAALEQNGFKPDPATYYVLYGDLQSAGCRNLQRLFARSIIKTWLTVRFDLVDKATGLTVWHDTYTGQTTMTNYSGGKFLATAFAGASDDVIRQLVTDRTFRNYFEP
jgi:hypothetical protein